MHPRNTVFMRLLCGAMALSLTAGFVCAEQEVFFHFDEGKGSTVHDASGRVTAALQGEKAPEWRSDESGSYLVFDDGDELLIVDSQGVLPRIFSGPSFTVELRVRLDKQEQASSWTELITYLSYRRPVCALEMGRRYGTPHFKVGSVHDHQTVFAMKNIGDDEWHHIKLVRDRGLGKFFVFVDGTLENEAPDGIDSLLPTSRPRLRLGGDLRGSIDEVRISSEGLPAEIKRQRQAFRWEGLEPDRDGILACRHADEPPKVDGLLTDACWDDAEQVLFVQRYKWEPPSQKTVGAALCDEEHLYFAFKCYETNMRELSMEVTDPNGPLYRDDVIEVFLDPQNRRENYHHLFVTAAGVYSDDGTLNRRWQARVRRTETYWTAEVAIPWRSIVERDTENTWIVSLARAERPHRETSCWQPTFGGFNVIKHFGRMAFESVDLRAISRRLHNERFAKRHILAGDETLEIQAMAGTYKIRRDESVRGLDRIALCAARGESEPFQLLVMPRMDGPLELSIDAEDLVDDGGHRIARTHVSCREIGYLGKVPDVLYPTDQYLGDHGTNRVFWILVEVPRDAVPGDYAGGISVAAGASRFRIPFTLRVWNFALPERVAFKTCLFAAKSSSIVHWYGHPVGTPEFERIYNTMVDSYISHRVSPGCALPSNWYDFGGRSFGTDPRIHMRKSVLSFEDTLYGDEARQHYAQWAEPLAANGLDLNYFPTRWIQRAGGTEAIRRFWETWYPLLEHHGWTQRTYIRPFRDELRDWKSATTGRELANLVRRFAPQIPVLATVNGDHFLIDDYINDVVDIWSLSTYVGMPEKVDYFQQRRHEGDRICPYIHTWAMLNNSALKLREFFWDLWRYRADGCTLWCVNGWYFEPEVSAYFKRFENMKKREDGGFDVLLQNLDLGAADCLFWPGKDQILDSIRLELIRDGIEDFECLSMAEERVSDKTIPGALRNRIRKTIDRYRNEFGEVGRNEETLSAASRELGELLSQSEAFAARERKGR